MKLATHLRHVPTAVRQKKRALGGTCRLKKGAPVKVSLDGLVEGGAANNANRGVNSIRPRLHPLRPDLAQTRSHTNFAYLFVFFFFVIPPENPLPPALEGK